MDAGDVITWWGSGVRNQISLKGKEVRVLLQEEAHLTPKAYFKITFRTLG